MQIARHGAIDNTNRSILNNCGVFYLKGNNKGVLVTVL